jgi:hypothetical protein
MEAEPPDMRYQAEPGNEYNHLGLLYSNPKSFVNFLLPLFGKRGLEWGKKFMTH